MSVTVPSADQAQALYNFALDRSREEWEQALADDGLAEKHLDSVRRLANSNKTALAGTTAYLLACLSQGENAQAARLWDVLTDCGEQWQEHPGWKAEWANPARAALR
ncbi:hypothetical protein OG345_40755 (plasmid) [Streptomyces sp. NBC_01220]|uniref:hypothetical protein n=1 Tax=Streptomyces sp. NBC_01220 TaxID=2903781 RepID=UPI002F907A66|nr:hypothetical protein OG345_40755 [Streptomyces sp. NBC_01220]